jgi:phosphoglycolate phosphatase-like HAD superfamily hydrolase
MAIDKVLFDMDGTIIDVKPEQEILDGIRKKYDDTKRRMWKVVENAGIPREKYGSITRMSEMYNMTLELLEAEGNDYKKHVVMGKLERLFAIGEKAEHEYSLPMPGAIEAMEEIKNIGCRIGVVTNASCDAFNEVARRFGFDRYVSEYSARGDGGLSYIKPRPDPIYRVLGKMGGPYNGFVMVGNSDHDARAAYEAKGKFILMDSGGFHEEFKEKFRPHAIVNSLRELPRLIFSI